MFGRKQYWNATTLRNFSLKQSVQNHECHSCRQTPRAAHVTFKNILTMLFANEESGGIRLETQKPKLFTIVVYGWHNEEPYQHFGQAVSQDTSITQCVLFWRHKWHGREGGGFPYKAVGMLVVSLRGVNFGFWSHLAYSEQNATKFSRRGLV